MFRNCILAAISTSVLIGVGCGSSSNSVSTNHVQAPSLAEQLEGKWVYDPEHLEEMIRSELAKGGIDVTVIPEADFDAIVASASEAIDITMVFSGDGTVSASSKVEDNVESFTSQWTIDGDSVQLIDEETDEVVTGTIVDGKLNIEMPVGVEGVQSIRLIKSND
jgi:hypothetical protein